MIELTDRRLNMVKVLARRLCLDSRQMREELTSIGNVALCKAAVDWEEGRGTAPDTWLWCRVRWAMVDHVNPNRNSDHRRWSKLVKPFSQLPGEDDIHERLHGREPEPVKALIQAESEERIKAVVACLCDEDRGLFLAVAFDGEPIGEAGKALGMKASTASYRMERCRMTLTRRLKGVSL